MWIIRASTPRRPPKEDVEHYASRFRIYYRHFPTWYQYVLPLFLDYVAGLTFRIRLLSMAFVSSAVSPGWMGEFNMPGDGWHANS
jgi:hypothetical protein